MLVVVLDVAGDFDVAQPAHLVLRLRHLPTSSPSMLPRPQPPSHAINGPNGSLVPQTPSERLSLLIAKVSPSTAPPFRTNRLPSVALARRQRPPCLPSAQPAETGEKFPPRGHGRASGCLCLGDDDDDLLPPATAHSTSQTPASALTRPHQPHTHPDPALAPLRGHPPSLRNNDLVVSCDFKWPFENRHDSGAQKACFPSVFADFFTILL